VPGDGWHGADVTPATAKLVLQLVRLAKGMISAVEVWVMAEDAQSK
jgi:hypothetical protein